MSGLLDNKSRVIDAIVTLEGRRQIALGDMRVEYVSFSDAGTYYKADIVSGSADATKRVFLEASNLPQDQITFEANDAGMLEPFRNPDGTRLKNGQVISASFTASTGSLIAGTAQPITIEKGTQFASTAGTLFAGQLENFKRLQLIATKDLIFEDEAFAAGNSNITFTMTNNRPLNDRQTWSAHLSELDSLFNDPRLSHIKNFKYLPPVNKRDSRSVAASNTVATSSRVKLGKYTPLSLSHLQGLTYWQIKRELSSFESSGYSKTVTFEPTSRNNNLVLQFFEQGYDQLRKLDVIDFGKHTTGNPDAPVSHIFFVGKLVIDNNETHTFVHLFTLVFE